MARTPPHFVATSLATTRSMSLYKSVRVFRHYCIGSVGGNIEEVCGASGSRRPAVTKIPVQQNYRSPLVQQIYRWATSRRQLASWSLLILELRPRPGLVCPDFSDHGIHGGPVDRGPPWWTVRQMENRRDRAGTGGYSRIRRLYARLYAPCIGHESDINGKTKENPGARGHREH